MLDVSGRMSGSPKAGVDSNFQYAGAVNLIVAPLRGPRGATSGCAQ